jgi:uncharacterized protein YjbI with pentapeptide repeats
MSGFTQQSDIDRLQDLLKKRQDIYNETNDYNKTLKVRINFEGADLRVADLREAILRQANLRQANLTDANLTGAILEGANLRKANLSGATLEGAILESANLGEVDLTGATLEGAKLIKANLIEAILREAILRQANLRQANLTRADLTGATLEGATLIKTHLREAILRQAILRQANLTDANLTSADLTGADLTGATLTGDGLIYGANLTGANLTGTNLTGANLRRAILREANLTGANLTGADLTGANLRGADLTGVIGAILRDDQMQQGRQPTPGRAFEIHNAFKNFEPKKAEYLALITQPDKPEIYNEESIYHYTNNIFKQNISALFPSEKEQKLTDFDKVFNKMNGYIPREKIELVGKSIDYAFSQDDDFKRQYIISFLDETCNAYGKNQMSCVGGIIERFVLTIGTVVEILCREGCEDETYKKLYKLMKGQMHHYDATKEWFETAAEDETIKKMNLEQRKANFIEFMTNNTSFSEDDAKKLADEIEDGFKELQFGGNVLRQRRKTRKSKKSRKTKRSRKSNKSSKK